MPRNREHSARCEIILGSISRVTGHKNLTNPSIRPFLCAATRFHSSISPKWISRHRFAFLSACETAVGVPGTPDEVIHLAAGLQFAGIKSIVGSLWKVNDSTVQRLVEAFYKNLCGDGKMNSKRTTSCPSAAPSGPVVGLRQGYALRPAHSVHTY
ncbi:CHAT domain-containing protein [Suillus subaureus]|uniref:CHAT domain-containing protein n=1 Tax=Suillus subaureus TaxID=48587 RepID=A0A9P7JE98_9AGAM|nr:CHAT domain-containing protein [Suillus subaureus]KAG1818136.1 CHAT domain-containing protein [Suillus subaureus]